MFFCIDLASYKLNFIRKNVVFPLKTYSIFLHSYLVLKFLLNILCKQLLSIILVKTNNFQSHHIFYCAIRHFLLCLPFKQF
jgi:hypothetical protein